MGGTLLCIHFNHLLEFFIAKLSCCSLSDPSFLLLKLNIMELFIRKLLPSLSSIGLRRLRYSKQFMHDASPPLIQSLLVLLSTEKDRVVLSSALYVLFQHASHKVGCAIFVKLDFFKSSSFLTHDGVADIESAQLQFLAFNYSFSCDEFIRLEGGCGVRGKVLASDTILDYPYEFLLAPTVDPFDFEGRIFFMTKYAMVTMTNLNPIIEPEIVQVLAYQALKVSQNPEFVVKSFLMLMSATLPFLDPEDAVSSPRGAL